MAGLQNDGTAPMAALSEVAAVKRSDSFDEKKSESAPPDSSNEYELDGIHDGLIFPTEEERATLRRVPDSIPWNAYLIAFVELAERFSFYGSSVVFTNFIQQPLPEGSRTGAGFTHGVSGALGMGQRASTGLTTFYQFWCYVTPLYGAYIADTYWGRYNTTCVAVVIALIGHIILIIAGVPGVINHQHGAVACFIIALLVMGFGTGLFKANISPLVAEQYRRTKLFVVTTSSGERVIVDPSLTISRVTFYLFINIGALIGQIGMTYSERYVGFWLAYTLPTVVFLLCPIVLFYGRKRYIRTPPTGSVLATALRLWRHAARGRLSWNPITCVRRLRAPGFWDDAKPSAVERREGSRPKWMTFDDQWVDEVRRGLSACAVFCWYPIYWLTYGQLNNNLTSQAATMVTGKVPNDVLSNLDPFALIIFIPICDLLIYPTLRRYGINFTQLKKITAGFVTGSAAMIWAAVVQHYIYKTNPCGDHAATCFDANEVQIPSPLNVWIQTGSYVLIAFSEILASITGLEYAFTKAPKNMRSLVMSVFLFMNAFSSALAEAFVSLSADPLLVWNYGVMAVLAAVTAVLVWFSVRGLDAKEDELNNLAEGHVGEVVTN
ncbi:Peptide transporter PTR2A [Mycena sanguinolenta]|uniref:Peptide transporter PTR2A n=1 Tax=Mycena sanguinolenta TaxID=230812 RepID=A0A8H7CK68_9AGAR|nr:Peptide transporter PTR2A [Mycena sanguinolenta]